MSICPKIGTELCKFRFVENKIVHQQASPAILGLFDTTLRFMMDKCPAKMTNVSATKEGEETVQP